MESNEVCIGGNKYRIVSSNAFETTETNIQESTSATDTDSEKLTQIVDILGGGEAGYAYVEMSVPVNEQSYEVNLGVNATQMHLRCDADVSIKLNTKTGDDINLLADDFPFTMSELRPNESIHRLFFTTGTSGAIIKVIAIGYR